MRERPISRNELRTHVRMDREQRARIRELAHNEKHPLAFWLGVRNAVLVIAGFVAGGLLLYSALSCSRNLEPEIHYRVGQDGKLEIVAACHACHQEETR